MGVRASSPAWRKEESVRDARDKQVIENLRKENSDLRGQVDSLTREVAMLREPEPTAANGPEEDAAKEAIKKERRQSLGSLPIATRANHIVHGVLPLAAAFERFDSDRSGGIGVKELRAALEFLGIGCEEGTAAAILKQYDAYPDNVLDVKEFASVVRDVQLLMEHDANGDGMLDRSELQRVLESLGLETSLEQCDAIIERFDVDCNGAIEVDELRDALRKLGVRAGALEAADILRRYDGDENGTLELHEFATLVRDLQLYAHFDENCDGEIDADELHAALPLLGLPTMAISQTRDVLAVWTTGCARPTLDLPSFSRLVSALRAFGQHDADRDATLSLVETRAALTALGIASDGKTDEQLRTDAGVGVAAAQTDAADGRVAAPAADGAAANAAPSDAGTLGVVAFVRLVRGAGGNSESALASAGRPLVITPIAHGVTLDKPSNKLTA